MCSYTRFDNNSIFNDVSEAQALGYQAKPVLLGPVTYLYLAKAVGSDFDKLSLLPQLLVAYKQILQRFSDQGVEWVQLDEPVLALELGSEWREAISFSYKALHTIEVKVLLASYYGTIAHHQTLVSALPVAGIHLDLVTAPEQLALFAAHLTADQVLSLGVINGRNVWAADTDLICERISAIVNDIKGRVWLAPSCSLLHTPVDLDVETKLASGLKQQLAFAKQKLTELTQLKALLSLSDNSEVVK